MPGPNDLVFVYGTLKEGGQYHFLMREAKGVLVGKGQLETPYPLVLAEYPCLLDRAGTGFKVKGEVYRLNQQSGWKKLDRLEGHPEEYRRRLETVRIDGQCHQAWTYFYLREDDLGEDWIPVEEFPVGKG